MQHCRCLEAPVKPTELKQVYKVTKEPFDNVSHSLRYVSNVYIHIRIRTPTPITLPLLRMRARGNEYTRNRSISVVGRASIVDTVIT